MKHMNTWIVALCLLASPVFAQTPDVDELERAAKICEEKVVAFGQLIRNYPKGYEACRTIMQKWEPIANERERLKREQEQREEREFLNRLGR